MIPLVTLHKIREMNLIKVDIHVKERWFEGHRDIETPRIPKKGCAGEIN